MDGDGHVLKVLPKFLGCAEPVPRYPASARSSASAKPASRSACRSVPGWLNLNIAAAASGRRSSREGGSRGDPQGPPAGNASAGAARSGLCRGRGARRGGVLRNQLGTPEELWQYFGDGTIPIDPLFAAIPAARRAEVDAAVEAAIRLSITTGRSILRRRSCWHQGAAEQAATSRVRLRVAPVRRAQDAGGGVRPSVNSRNSLDNRKYRASRTGRGSSFAIAWR